MSKPVLPKGLYAITDSDYIQPSLLGNAVQHAILGGAVMVQYRDKGRNPGRRKREAIQLRDICHDHDVPLIINDDVRLAEEIQADGVHLGRDDWSVETARKALGDSAIIGASCYNSMGFARRARDEGADYVAFGSFFPTQTKERAERATSDILTEASTELDQHIVAIGGIKPENGANLIRAGADMIAACSGVFDRRDSESASHHYAALFRNAALLD
ncbi:MAG: thiamine phosphate synthase [Gammaproteobacteria bacterium]|nr:thiamine phosphate synthase [Gammaproteobacteria bacterium]MDH3767022.1 thiamine phosphate synthase [Gammaproteobacteria bacterium]